MIGDSERRLPELQARNGQRVILATLACTLLLLTGGTAAQAQQGNSKIDVKAVMEAAKKGSDSKKDQLPDATKVTDGFEKINGLFTLYRKKNRLIAELRPSDMGKTYLLPIAIARGLAQAGTPLNFGDEWVLTFKRVGDRVQIIRKNIHYEAPKGTPLARAVKQNYTDSILKAVRIVGENKGNKAVLIDLNDIFFGDFAELGIGRVDSNRTSWHKVNAFPNNLELEVETTYSGLGYFGSSGATIDSRGQTVVIHYSLMKPPAAGYKPRFADNRVGHFLSATVDYGSKDPTTTFKRRINRWRLEKANPKAKLSAPKKQLIWWVEDTVPHAYRPYVEAGILEWNKAFERIGYRNAIGVRWQNADDKFDPEDTRYCTFRWITTPNTYAMSGLRANPITGEMIDGDVIFDASWVRAWTQQYAVMVGEPIAQADGSRQGARRILGVGEIISPMLAAKQGYGLTSAPDNVSWNQIQRRHPNVQAMPLESSPLHQAMVNRIGYCGTNGCQCAMAKRQEYSLAALAFAARRGEGSSDNGKKKPEEEEADDLELPEEFIGNAIKEVVMHEVGHSLGLRHNFRASAMLSLKEINDTEITEEKGMTGSVMDYNPLNISRKGQPQGDYVMTTIGPYDYWAIEYAYADVKGDEEKGLAKIAARSPSPELAFATDDDLYLSNDPLVNTYDLGNDPLLYAKDRVALAQELMNGLDETAVRDGQSWSRLRSTFSALLSQYGNAAYMASSYVGGEYVSRDAKGDGDERDPIVPVEGDKQREALAFLMDEILSDKAYHFDPQILRRLGAEHWSHWGSYFSSAPGMDVYNRVLAIQKIALAHCLDSNVLDRIQNQALLVDADSKPLTMDEVFRTLTDGIWSPLKNKQGENSVFCRNLQREHVTRLSEIVIGDRANGVSNPFLYIFVGNARYSPDARSLARMHLREIKDRVEEAKPNDDLTKAHCEDISDLIGKVLDARMEANL